MNQSNLHIVVGGANRGIGLEFCRQAKAKGHRVTALCRSRSEALDSLEISVIDQVEVTSPPSFDSLGSVDWLILNAGIWRDESLPDLNFDTIREQFEVNTLGPLKLYQKLSPHLSDGSKIGLMSSLMGSLDNNTSGGRYGYRISKAALNCAGVSLAHDLKESGIAVGLLHPGYVATDMTKYKGTITPEESVKGLFQVMEQLDLDNSGSFWNYRGETLAW